MFLSGASKKKTKKAIAEDVAFLAGRSEGFVSGATKGMLFGIVAAKKLMSLDLDDVFELFTASDLEAVAAGYPALLTGLKHPCGVELSGEPARKKSRKMSAKKGPVKKK